MNSTNLAATMNHILENRPPILSSKNLMEEKQPKKKNLQFSSEFFAFNIGISHVFIDSIGRRAKHKNRDMNEALWEESSGLILWLLPTTHKA